MGVLTHNKPPTTLSITISIEKNMTTSLPTSHTEMGSLLALKPLRPLLISVVKKPLTSFFEFFKVLSV